MKPAAKTRTTRLTKMTLSMPSRRRATPTPTARLSATLRTNRLADRALLHLPAARSWLLAGAGGFYALASAVEPAGSVLDEAVVVGAMTSRSSATVRTSCPGGFIVPFGIEWRFFTRNDCPPRVVMTSTVHLPSGVRVGCRRHGANVMRGRAVAATSTNGRTGRRRYPQ